MAHFSSAIVTKAGIDLALGAAAGVQSIEFVKMVSGNGEYTEEEKGRDALRERSGLKSQMQEFPFNSVEITSKKTAVLKSIITNKELTDGYRITEIGVYARAKGTEGDGVLYSIALAIESDYLPPFVNPAEIIQEYYITVSDTAEISIVSNPGAYALAEDLEKLREDIESTGLLGEENGGGTGGGEGDSTSIIGTMQKDISDLKSPVFEMAENRGNIESGETTSIIFGKIKKWFTDLKEAAFATIVNHCLATEPGTVLDGRVGKDLQEQIDELKEADEAINSNMDSLGGFTPIIDSTGKITGYKTEVGADTVFPFSSFDNLKMEHGGGTGGFTINAVCKSDGKAVMFCGSRSYSGNIYFRKNGNVLASSPVNNTIVYLDRIIDVKKGDVLQLQQTEINSNYYTAGCIIYP